MKRAWIGVACLVAGCGASQTKIVVPVAERWTLAPPAHDEAAPQPTAAFWDRFACAELRTLLNAAATSSLETASAAARVARDEALERVARAPLYPTLGAEVVGAGQSANSTRGERGVFLDLGLVAAYEVDVWGRAAKQADASEARSSASRYERASVALAVAAGVADTYFEVLSLRERATRGRANLTATQRVLEIVEAKHAAGAALAREVSQQRALVASEAVRVEQFAQAEAEARVSLAIASGRLPHEIKVQNESLDAVTDPTIVPTDVGVPATLLARRPDIARAEAQLAASQADVSAARAALWPKLRLNARAAYQSVFLSDYYDGSAWLATGLAELSYPIFDGGALSGERDAAAARRVEAEAEYRRIVLTAVGEVERALRALDGVHRQSEQQRVLVDEARRAFQLIELEYQAGAGELVAVLDAQRTLFRAEDDLTLMRLGKLRATVALMKALGGGWSERR